MNGETALAHIEEKIDTHIKQHNKDFRSLLGWAVGIILSVIGTLATWFVTWGTIQEKVAQIEARQQSYVTRSEFDGLKDLLNEKFQNVNQKLDDIREGLKL